MNGYRGDNSLVFSAALVAIAMLYAIQKLYALEYAVSDENIYFYLASAMAHGKVPYRDFFHAHPHPPLHLYPLALVYKVQGGFSLLPARVLSGGAILLAGILIARGQRRSSAAMGLIACALFLGSFDVLRVSTHYVGANLAAFWVALGLERFARVRDGQAALAFSLGGFTLLNALLEFRPRRKSRGARRLDARTLALYESEVRIPLIVKSPYQTRGLRIARPVQAIDIVPTVIELLHIESDTPFDGASLLTDSNEPALILWNKHKVVRTAEWKLYATEDPPQLFRIDRDPGELHNVATKHPEVIKQLRDLRDARLSRIRQSEKNIDKLTTEAVEQMRTLGYIE